ncbi:MAG: hypothetical protein GQ570_06570 [Helicobacteraceae bacterium]|nr:hypothetical protein [Helicobacteraceae bacterium]
MKKIVKVSLLTVLTLNTTLLAEVEEHRARMPSIIQLKTAINKTFEPELHKITSGKDIFSQGVVSGQIRVGHIHTYSAVENSANSMSTAIGGQLKYETAIFNGVNLGVAMYTAQDISSGEGNEFSNYLLSDKKNYAQLAEAYVNYKYESFNFKGGRQLIDTPLADSNDISMTPHTFEAYVASYEVNNFTFIGANIQKWQGVDTIDANGNWDGNSWAQTGENNRDTWMGAVTYENDIVDASGWYYNIGEMANAAYFEALSCIDIKNVEIEYGIQYLNESELDNSNVKGTVIGAWGELIANDFGLNIAFNQAYSKDDKYIFGGFGGGPFFTNMNLMTADNLSDSHGTATSIVTGVTYSFDKLNFLAAYGDFRAEAGVSAKAHVSELDVGFEYDFYENANLVFIYVIGDDKESNAKTEYDNSHIQLIINYNF